jgi:acyl-CoA thioesterase FadM
VQEINFANHLANDKFLSLTEEVYQRYLHAEGFTGGLLFGRQSVIAGAQIQFLHPGKFGDLLELKFWFVSHGSKSFRVFAQLQCGAREIGRVQLDRVFVDPNTDATCPCPPAFLEYINHKIKASSTS